jgi:SPP1 family predicted phage head-tail adaptor
VTAMLSAGQLASMRSTLNASLPDTAAVHRDTLSSDSAGGYTTSAATVATVACRVSPSGGRESVVAGKVDAVSTWTITLPALTDVTAKDRLIVGSRTFEVAAVLDPRSWEIGRRVLCVEIL